ncbi:hypothetical protein Y032_0209g2113 [Ancylostoma ceylanicum]|uniref:MARVEL domain-containing protein n=1 Tax=Ancylostoma ceylanicum TaxID=53326 RepID=A0A016SLI0_9BILA|nr:hypothetical protein Y032_0209g2113 [Ancylostoma ceylanicum]
MPGRTIHTFYKKVNDKFTTFSLSVAAFIEARSLLNVPEKQWKLFSALAYIHIVLSIFLCVLGIICFCFGMVHSVLYTEVSCSNGVNLFMPFLNVVSSFAGLIALRALHMNWPPFIHVITLFLAIWSLSMITVVSCVEANDWYSQAAGTPEPIPAGVKFTNWARIFADMDVIITSVAIVNLIVECVELAIYVKYWLLRPNGS